LNYKKFATEEIPESYKCYLLVTNQGSLFLLCVMNFDKYNKKESTEADVLLNRSSFYFFDKDKWRSTEHYETIGSDAYKFENLLITMETNQTRYYYWWL
jgi:hypothetical protein